MATKKASAAAREAAVRRHEQAVRERKAKQRKRILMISGAAALAVVLVAVVTVVIVNSRKAVAAPRIATGEGYGLVVGSGPVTVEVYEDYICPICRSFEADAQDEIERYLADDSITLILHPIAILDEDTSSNEYSTRASAAAGCSADDGKLLEYSNALFAQQPVEDPTQPGPTDDELIDLGSSIGLGDTFAKCVQDERYVKWVGELTQAMSDRGLTLETPTILVDGTRLLEFSGSALAAAIDAAKAGPTATSSATPSATSSATPPAAG